MNERRTKKPFVILVGRRRRIPACDDHDLLLEDRFKLKMHKEERPLTAWKLVAVKPKMKKADPSERTKTAEGPGADGKDPRRTMPFTPSPGLNIGLASRASDRMRSANFAGQFPSFQGKINHPMELNPGAKLGPYEILSRIGEGGMGQVWKARDTRLDRMVAIKTSAARFSERFEREARAVAALNHPHICTLYDVGPDYLVMEYVEGSEIKGPLPLDQALKYAIQLASALEAAHKKLITHRDLKPANVLLAKSGVKVLDFGLAKTGQAAEAKANDETLTRALTQEGSIVGTLQYMAPEQLQGKITDVRADIFSFGCVLYEMLTGKRAFEGSNTASVIAAILEREPPSVGDVAPASLDWLLKRCLAKDPDERWQTARDLRAAMERIDVIVAETRASRPPRLPLLAWGVAGAMTVAAGGLGFVHLRETPATPPVTRLSINPPEGGHFPGNGSPPVISPDGTKVIFHAVSGDGGSHLWLRPLDSTSAQPLTRTENATLPFWSPDSKSIGFFEAGKLERMAIAGGAPTVLAAASDGRGGTWNQDGVIVFSPAPFGGLMRVSAAGGTVRPVVAADPNNPMRFPSFLPDGKHVLYLSGTLVGTAEGKIGIASLDSPADDRVLAGTVSSFAVYANGNLLYARGNGLVAQPFDTRTLAFKGDAMSVADRVQVARSPNGMGGFSVSGNGVLIYRSGGTGDTRLTWMDRAGKRTGTVGDAGDTGATTQLSPDRRTAAVTMTEPSGGNIDIWLYDLLRGVRTRFTFDPAIDAAPVWSPDGRTIVFRSTRPGPGDLYRKPADGSRNEELLYADKLTKSPTSFSPDGKVLAYEVQDPKTGYDIWILPDPLGPAGAAKPYPFVHTDFSERDPQFSPDGHWIAYYSTESGKYEVYVTPFPGPGGKRQVSAAGGTNPRWRADGRELYYVSADGHLTAAQVDAKGGAFEVTKVDALFGPVSGLGGFDVSADGQRFLALLPPEGDSGEPLTVVQNWTAGLKK